MSFLGLDVGTSGCKAVAFDRTGRQLARAYREYPVRHSHDGWAELDSEQVCRECFAVIAEVAAATADDPVEAMAVSSQGEAFTPVDAAGRILAPAMVSSDTRAATLSRDWPDTFGRERLYRITGQTPHPMYTLFKLLWTREQRPDVWRTAAKFLCFEDLIHSQLGLPPHIGWPLAGRTMVFDVSSHRWSPEILAAIDLDPQKLATPLPSGAVVGTIPQHVAASLGLSDKVVIVTGGHDQMCSALGAGIAEPGEAMYATGTVECLAPVFEQPVFSPDLMVGNLCTYDACLPDMYGTIAFCLTGGNLLQWYRDQFAALERAEAERRGCSSYEVILDQMPDEPTSLLVLPYFTPSGTPHFDLHTPGAIYGLRLSTSRAEILRGLLEGVAYEMRANTDLLARAGVAIRQFRATGGGARNDRWNQLKADVLGVPLTTVPTTEAGCCGAAMLAAAARLQTPVRDLARQWITTGQVFEPNPSRHAHYTEQFERYQRLYQAVRKV